MSVRLSILRLCLVFGCLGYAPALAWAQSPNQVTVDRGDDGWRLMVDGEPFFVTGMNWGYMPIGENYTYDFWGQPPETVKAAVDTEMGLLRDMGVNAIRQYNGIPPEWVTYIYENYGIYTMINHTMGRYGYNIDGVWRPNTNYQDPRTREVIKADILKEVERYKNTPGMLFWLLGNENNYGLEWSSFEIENLPKDERHQGKAVFLYSLYGEIIDAIHAADPHHPVSIANGDLQYSDLIKEHAPNLDILGSNVYRGISSRDLFDRVADELELPFIYTEFGSDAYNARMGREDHLMQARYLHGQWQEIYEHTAGKGRANNAIGGFVFQWSDGWWKTGQTVNLNIHDPDASWENGAYPDDLIPGQNNMNEEWFGICSKGPRDQSGLYTVYPRTAYYVLKEDWKLDPYAPSTDLKRIQSHFNAIQPQDYAGRYEAADARRQLEAMQKVVMTNLRSEVSFWTVGGSTLGSDRNERAMDHMESFYPSIRIQPNPNVSARAEFNVLGNVNSATINEIFYEDRGEPLIVEDVDGKQVVLNDRERIKLYAAEMHLDQPGFSLDTFYRVGHYHWGYEGDFFGMYREAYYGENLDIYNGDAPFGFEWTGKKKMDGFKIAAGPQIYWGANPAVLGKYYKLSGPTSFAVVHQEDIASPPIVGGQRVIQEQLTRKTSVYGSYSRGLTKYELGGLLAGTEKLGQTFMSAQGRKGPSYVNSGYAITEDEIYWFDMLGTKGKVTTQMGPVSLYAQGAYKGRVADGGGPDSTQTITGWSLKEDERGNQWNVLTGLAFNLGMVQVAPNVIYQRPLDGPLPAVDGLLGESGIWYPNIRPRNKLESPFAVLGNREMIGAEVLFTYDTTPGTWMWDWDSDFREDAPFAASLDLVFRRYTTTRDASFGWTEDGVMFAFGASPPAADLWEANGRVVMNTGKGVRVIVKPFAGTGQADGDDQRLVERYGVSNLLWWNQSSLETSVKIGDWGPYDYHRDFNLTYPLQLSADLSRGFGTRVEYDFPTRFGLLGNLRYLDRFSPDFVISPNGTWGHEWELATYLEVSL